MQLLPKRQKKQLTEKGITFFTGAKVLSERRENKLVTINAEIADQEKSFSAEKVLVSVGRSANVEDIGLQNTDIEIENGCIKVNPFYQTKESHIYAIGDVIGGLQLAHVASHEGLIAVEHMLENEPQPLNYDSVARCIYSQPEVASVGITEEEARARGYQIKTGTFSFSFNGKALILGEAEGFAKVIANSENNDLLGVHLIGPKATDLISEAAWLSLSMLLTGSLEQ